MDPTDTHPHTISKEKSEVKQTEYSTLLYGNNNDKNVYLVTTVQKQQSVSLFKTTY